MRFVEDPVGADVERVAEEMANTACMWVQRRQLVCFEAVRLQIAAGRSQAETARMFGMDPKTIRGRQDEWPKLDRAGVLALRMIVKRALWFRRALLGLRENTISDDKACAFVQLPEDDAPEPRATLFLTRPDSGERAEEIVVDAVVHDDWETIAHPAQLPPAQPWRTWLLMGGRGAGKTRAGAEWVRSLVESGLAKRVALVGPSLHEVREVMVDGVSGLCAIGPEDWRPTYEPTRRRLVWRKGPGAGAVAMAFSAEDPDGLRGSQFDAAWCDEIGAWAKDMETWRTLAFAMRLGPAPRIVATTTPRPRALVKALVAKSERAQTGVKMTKSSTRANAGNLAPEFVEGLEEDYRGTTLARQEIDGDLVEDAAGALWAREVIERGRALPADAEGLERVVVAVDPPAGAGPGSDACGIVVAGVKAGVVYVLHDATVRGLRPAAWGARVAAVAEAWGAGVVVAEGNQGGEMVRDVLQGACGRGVKVVLRHAGKAKRDRAEPVSQLYEQGRVRHVRVLSELEDEMCAFGAADVKQRSPDRVDALVWAVSELGRKAPRPWGAVL